MSLPTTSANHDERQVLNSALTVDPVVLGEIAQLQAQVELVSRQLKWASDAAMASISSMPRIQELLCPHTQPYGPPPPELCGRPYQDHVHDVAILRLTSAICCIDSTLESLHVRPLALL